MKISGYIFWVLGCFDSKLLKIIMSHLLKSVNWRSEVSSHHMYSKMLRQFSKGSLMSISSESSKIHLLIKVLYSHIWFNLCRRYSLFHNLNISVLLAAVQLYNVLVLRSLDMKYSTLPKIDVYNFRYKICVGILMKIFFLSHKCINK